MDQYKHLLRHVQSDFAFVFQDGSKAHSLNELYHILKEHPEYFANHVNEHKNDFYNWIKEIIEDTSLAERLEKTTDYELFIKKLKHRVDYLAHKEKEIKNERSVMKKDKVVVNEEDKEYGLGVEYIRSGAKDFVLGLIIGIILGVVILQML